MKPPKSLTPLFYLENIGLALTISAYFQIGLYELGFEFGLYAILFSGIAYFIIRKFRLEYQNQEP